MCWTIDYTNCVASYDDGIVNAQIDYLNNQPYLRLYIHNVRLNFCIWDCKPKNLKEAVCATKRGLRDLASKLCSASKAGVQDTW